MGRKNRCPKCGAKVSPEKSEKLHVKSLFENKLGEFDLENFEKGCSWCKSKFKKIRNQSWEDVLDEF